MAPQTGATALWAAAILATAAGITPPDLTLDTIPIGYFGGNAGHRGNESIAWLAKCKIIIIEKWEGHCWEDCLNDPNSTACLPSCDVESLMLDTIRRVKEVNPKVSAVFYFNTLLDFPFYQLHQRYVDAGALTIDSVTKQPMKIRNDNGMEGIYVFGIDSEAGVQLYIDAVKNFTATGIVDGFFGDKWDKGAFESSGVWKICNHECGTVNATQAAAWNEGKRRALAAVVPIVGNGPYFVNGDSFEGVYTNSAHSGNGFVTTGDPQHAIKQIQSLLLNHSYVYIAAEGDQKWVEDPNAPATIESKCLGDCVARFLLFVEPGVFLGTNGWDATFDLPLGNPLGPATYTPANGGHNATLHRNFSSGTSVVFTYDGTTKDYGQGVVYWGGKPPTPPTPAPPTPAPPIVPCGGYRSTRMNDTTFSHDDTAPPQTTATALGCCEACGATPGCVEWAWHGMEPKVQSGQCHLHGNKSQLKTQIGTVAGVMQR